MIQLIPVLDELLESIQSFLRTFSIASWQWHDIHMNHLVERGAAKNPSAQLNSLSFRRLQSFLVVYLAAFLACWLLCQTFASRYTVPT